MVSLWHTLRENAMDFHDFHDKWIVYPQDKGTEPHGMTHIDRARGRGDL
jgi:hypothetical protein